MTYEVTHGERTEFVEAGNPHCACLQMLRREAADDSVQMGPFTLSPLPMGEEHTIPMSDVLRIRLLASNHPNDLLPDKWETVRQ